MSITIYMGINCSHLLSFRTIVFVESTSGTPIFDEVLYIQEMSGNSSS